MNLAALVTSALAAVPAGIRGTATFRRVVTGAVDYVTDTTAGDHRTDATGVTVVVLPNAPTRPGVQTRVVEHDVVAYVSGEATPWPIEVGMLMLVDGGETFRVVDVETLKPDGVTAALYTVRGKR